MHWNALLNLLKYVRDTQDLCITYGGVLSADDENQLLVYADADFSRHPDRRKSRSGHLVFLNNGAVSQKSSLQKRIATSTSESELYSLYDASKSAAWFRNLLSELGFPQRTTRCFEDNKGVVDWVAARKVSSRMSALPTEYYWLREANEIGDFSTVLISTLLQKADILTKQMDPAIFYRLLELLYNISFSA